MIKIAKEKAFENKIKAYLKSIGAYFIKTHGDRFSRVGTPDIIACVNGHFVAVEVKAENGKPSELQLYHLEQIALAGGYGAIIVPTEGVEKIKTYISKNYPEYDNTNVIDLKIFKKVVETLLTSQQK